MGHDDLGRPVIYSCLRNASNRSTEDNRLHMLATFEQVPSASVMVTALISGHGNQTA